MVGGPVWLKFKLLLDIMHVLYTYEFKMDQINSNQEKVATSIFRRSRAANSVVRGQIWPNLKFVQALIYVIITCKYEKDLIKTAEKKWQHRFSHYRSMGIFFSDAQWQLTLQSVIGSGRI